jgi:murein L,D-transpeptidase YafK
MTDEQESEVCLGTVDTEAVQSKANLVEKAKKIGFKSAEIDELKRLYPDLKRTTSNLFLLILPAFLATGCVLTTLDVDTRGKQPIPSKLVREMESKSMSPSDPILVRIFKQESELEVWKRDKSGKMALLKTYPMCRWSGKLGPKKKTGDRQAPEGIYHVSASMLNPKSKYHLSFNLGYPNRLESALGYTGDALMVHGACSSSGCFAITDEAVGEVYAVAREALKGEQNSFQVQSFPFRMTPENMAKNSSDPNYRFWQDIKVAYDFFEIKKRQPSVSYCGGRYVFETGPLSSANPLAVCPAIGISDPQVLAKLIEDDEKINTLLRTGEVTIAYQYSDGGMHPAFRRQLKLTGAKTLAKRTSFSAVPISRPNAALSDPYSPSIE